MARLFISYRREDTQYQADRLHAAIRPHVDDPARDIFIDIDNIPLGVNFAAYLDEKVSQCEVLLALIGPRWLEARGPGGERRLDDPGDFVRIEIASALKRGIPVVPVLFDGAPVPLPGVLPEDLKELSLRNGVEIRRATFEEDTLRLARGLGLIQVPAPEPEPAPEPAPSAGDTDWAAIEDSVEPGNYAAFAEHYPGHAMAAEARRRVRQLEAWHNADRSNADAVAAFRTAAAGEPPLFPALDTHTRRIMDRLARPARKPAGARAGQSSPAKLFIPLIIGLLLGGGAITYLTATYDSGSFDGDGLIEGEIPADSSSIVPPSAMGADRPEGPAELPAMEDIPPSVVYSGKQPQPADTQSGTDIAATRAAEGIEAMSMGEYGRALALLPSSCDAGDGSACNALGAIYRNGLGMAQDYGRAASYFRAGCERGAPMACYNLGDLVDEGLGVPRDRAEATELYRLACDGGADPGCARMEGRPD